MAQLFALKMTITNRLGTLAGLATAPSEDYDATCKYRDNLITQVTDGGDFGAITLVDGQTMVTVPASLTKESVVVFEVITPE